MKRLNSALCILYTENTVRVWPDESGVTLVVQRDIPSQHKEKPRSFLRNYGVNLVVEYSRLANTHPAGVRRTVLKLPLNEEYGGHPRTCSNHLTG